MSHVTGGGLVSNLPRVLPREFGVEVGLPRCRPALFDLLSDCVEESEQRRVFNLGVGFVVVVPPRDHDRATALLETMGEDVLSLGEVIPLSTDTPDAERVRFL
jgi:phosphoribosylformylglycinamidine cyclo-ligase